MNSANIRSAQGSFQQETCFQVFTQGHRIQVYVPKTCGCARRLRGSLHMPLIVRWPGRVRPGGVSTHLVSKLDFAQTFLDMAGVPAPADMQGESLLPLLKGQSPPGWRKSFYYRYCEFPQPRRVPPHYGVRTERHKLIHYPLTGEWELFDLAGDPHEMRSLMPIRRGPVRARAQGGTRPPPGATVETALS